MNGLMMGITAVPEINTGMQYFAEVSSVYISGVFANTLDDTLSWGSYVDDSINMAENGTTTVYRGVRANNPSLINNQVSNMLRIQKNNSSWLDSSNLNLPVITDEQYNAAVMNLAKNPTEENFQILINMADSPQQKVQLENSFSWAKSWQEATGISFSEALARGHVDTMVGTLNTSPYVSAATSFEKAAGYVGNNGVVVQAEIPNSRITMFPFTDTEVGINGLIFPNEIVKIIQP
jgi:hypothetical protein